MKNSLIYGGALAIANALFTLVLYFLGLHSDVAKLGTAQGVGFVGTLAIGITCVVLGIKACRDVAPTDEDFTYGRALGSGVMIVLVGSLLGMITTILYGTVVNPGFNDIVAQAQVQKWEAMGMGAAQIESAEKVMRSMMRPPIQAVFGFLGGMIGGTIISLLAAIFLKRTALEASGSQPPSVA